LKKLFPPRKYGETIHPKTANWVQFKIEKIKQKSIDTASSDESGGKTET
jgi:hypothetical protein